MSPENPPPQEVEDPHGSPVEVIITFAAGLDRDPPKRAAAMAELTSPAIGFELKTDRLRIGMANGSILDDRIAAAKMVEGVAQVDRLDDVADAFGPL